MAKTYTAPSAELVVFEEKDLLEVSGGIWGNDVEKDTAANQW